MIYVTAEAIADQNPSISASATGDMVQGQANVLLPAAGNRQVPRPAGRAAGIRGQGPYGPREDY